MKNEQWRIKFIELSENIFREMGFSPPSMVHEECMPLAMELEIDGFSFELLHSPSALNDQILIICKLGHVPSQNEIFGMLELLKANLNTVRMCGARFGIKSESREINLMCHKNLDDLSAPTVLQDMRKMILENQDWEARFFDPRSSAPGAQMELPNSILA